MAESDYQAGNPPHNGSTRLVVVSGCSSGGKSTLLTAMQERGYPIMPEPGRQIVKEQQYIGGSALPWEDPVEFCRMCLARGMYFFNTATPTDKPVLFDRSIIDAARALIRQGVDDNSVHSAISRYRYAPTVFLVPPWPELFVTDAERKNAYDDAVAEYEDLLAAYANYGYDVVIIPKDSIAARADFLAHALTKL